jgi:hypothetical protein
MNLMDLECEARAECFFNRAVFRDKARKLRIILGMEDRLALLNRRAAQAPGLRHH